MQKIISFLLNIYALNKLYLQNNLTSISAARKNHFHVLSLFKERQHKVCQS